MARNCCNSSCQSVKDQSCVLIFKKIIKKKSHQRRAFKKDFHLPDRWKEWGQIMWVAQERGEIRRKKKENLWMQEKQVVDIHVYLI